ncbi:hypothetical protein ABW21_db0207958 [Orbilia brochopaga]|nr:hypothetical protein ABW21_db0207958 [Drechslerella brochopaga]
MSAASSALSERLALLTNAYQEVTVQIDRLASLMAAGTEEARGELAGLIQQGLKEGEAELESADCDTESYGGSTGGAGSADTSPARGVQDALLTSKRASALAARQQRQLLSTPTSPPLSTTSPSSTAPATPISGAQLYRRPYHSPASKRKEQATQDDMLTSASSDVSAALRRTHALMSAELARSHFAHDTLSESTAALRELSGNYSAFDGALKRSKGLITSLVRKNKSDMWYYQMSLYALIATIAWLVFRRLLWGPVWLLVWMPLRILIYLAFLPFRVPREQTVEVVGGAGGGSESMVVSIGDVKSTIERVVETMTVTEKTIVLDDGVVVEVPLDSGEAIHDEL